MASRLSPETDARPPLNRSRSHTIPSDSSPVKPIAAPTARPTHGRSHSYLSPVDRKPRISQTLPVDKLSRLHIPGTGQRHSQEHYRHPLRHRHTQSHHDSNSRVPRTHDNEALPHLVAKLSAEREKTKGGNEVWHTRANELIRIASQMNPRGGQLILGEGGYASDLARQAARQRGISDPRPPQAPRVPKSAVEIALDRADARRKGYRASLTQKDIEAMKREKDDADAELRDRLADVGRANAEITRRLDYTFYALLEKLGSLVTTIQTFQSLSTQSRQLIENFEHETAKLDDDIKRRVQVFKRGFEDREIRIADLELRGRTASTKAQDLSQRLENARIIVENWEKRERAARRKWGRFWGGLWWSLLAFFLIAVGTFVGREWWFRGDPVRAGLGVPRGGFYNASLVLDAEALKRIDVPPGVRSVLEGIEERRANKPVWSKVPEVRVPMAEERREDARLRALDEL